MKEYFAKVILIKQHFAKSVLEYSPFCHCYVRDDSGSKAGVGKSRGGGGGGGRRGGRTEEDEKRRHRAGGLRGGTKERRIRGRDGGGGRGDAEQGGRGRNFPNSSKPKLLGNELSEPEEELAVGEERRSEPDEHHQAPRDGERGDEARDRGGGRGGERETEPKQRESRSEPGTTGNCWEFPRISGLPDESTRDDERASVPKRWNWRAKKKLHPEP